MGCQFKIVFFVKILYNNSMQQNQAEQLRIKLENGRIVLVRIDHPSSKYHGSIVSCHNDPYYFPSSYSSNIQFQVSAPELSRKLNFNYASLLLTKEKKIKLTNAPIWKKKLDVKDFSKRTVCVNNVLFGEGKLIRIDNILSNGICEVTCIKAIKDVNEGKIIYYKTLKHYIWIEDPTMLILTLS